MKSERNYRIYLEDMLSSTEKALSFTKGLDADSFAHNEEKMYAVIRALEILGEAAKHIPSSVRRNYPGVPWQKIAGTRDKLIHAYFDIHSDRLFNNGRERLTAVAQGTPDNSCRFKKRSC